MSGVTAPSAFGAADHALLELLRIQNDFLRAALCTLARRGVAFRRREPARAQAWIEVLGPHPMFKAGQFLFDLMEWEDFMLDGDPPAAADREAGDLLGRVREMLGIVSAEMVSAEADATATALPELEPGFHLYRDVVLGGIDLGFMAVS